MTNEELAAALKEWRGARLQREAAALLGIKVRTYQGIEQGRGFVYPSLLLRAINQSQTMRGHEHDS